MRTFTVEYYSPGTFVAESSSKDIDSWDVAKAVEMARDVTERYNATPYAFQFHEWISHPPIDDGEGGTLKVAPKKVRSSGMYFLHADLMRFDDIPDSEDKRILKDNMRGNKVAHVVVNNEGWRNTQPFQENDVLLKHGVPIATGRDPEITAYRERKLADYEAYYEQLLKEWALQNEPA